MCLNEILDQTTPWNTHGIPRLTAHSGSLPRIRGAPHAPTLNRRSDPATGGGGGPGLAQADAQARAGAVAPQAPAGAAAPQARTGTVI